MRVTFAHDKRAKKPHYQVRHANIGTAEFGEVFSKPVVVIGRHGTVLKAVGRTFKGRFLTVVFIRRGVADYHVITAWPSTRRQILLWDREIKRR